MPERPSPYELDFNEHVGPSVTGDNIDAKRAALYGWYPTGSQWNRVQVDTNGVVQVSSSGGGSGGTSSTYGATFPTTGTAIGFEDASGNMQPGGALVSGTANSTGNAILVGPTTMSQTFSYTAITTGTSYDVGNYKSVSVQVNTQYVTSTINFQTSNDNTNWIAQTLVSSGATASTGSTNTASAAVMYEGTIRGRYFRINVTGTYSSGTCAGVITFSTGTTSPVSLGGLVTFNGITGVGPITTSSSSIATTSTTGYGGFATITVHGTYSGVSFGVTASEDSGSTFYPIPVYDSIAMQWLPTGTTITPGTNASRVYWVSVMPYDNEIKVLASAYASGTCNVRIEFSNTGNPASTMAQLMDAAGNARGANVTAANALLVDSSATTQPVSGNTGTPSAPIVIGQTTSNTTPVQLSSASYPMTNGILIQALSTNTASVFIGPSGVTTSTGFELQKGQSASSSAANLDLLYVIGSNNADKVCWNVT